MTTVTYDYTVGTTAAIKLPVVVDYRYNDKDASMVTGKVVVSQLGMYGPWNYSFEATLAECNNEECLEDSRILVLIVKDDANNCVTLDYDNKWLSKNYGHRDRAVLEALIDAFS